MNRFQGSNRDSTGEKPQTQVVQFSGEISSESSSPLKAEKLRSLLAAAVGEPLHIVLKSRTTLLRNMKVIIRKCITEAFSLTKRLLESLKHLDVWTCFN